MIADYSECLYQIYQQVPVYANGKSYSLDSQFKQYKAILLAVASMDVYKSALEPLLAKSEVIQLLISQADAQKGDVQEDQFNATLKLLSDDICTLLQILKFTSASV